MAMESTPKTEPGGSGGDPSPEEIQAEIEATREELGDTFAEIAEKADVKKQAKRKAAETKAKAEETKAKAVSKAEELKAKATPDSAQQVASQAGQAARENPVPTAAIGAFVGGIVVGWVLGRR